MVSQIMTEGIYVECFQLELGSLVHRQTRLRNETYCEPCGLRVVRSDWTRRSM
jgi:hypothetical protein